jgi:hypothetical protein
VDKLQERLAQHESAANILFSTQLVVQWKVIENDMQSLAWLKVSVQPLWC